MIYVKVDVSVTDHPRFEEAGMAATGLWLRGLAYVRRHELDGRLPKRWIESRPADDRAADLAGRLVAVGLWRDAGDHYEILKYAEKGNETKAQITERKRQNAAKMRGWRSRNQVTNSFAGSVTNLDVTGYGSGSGSEISEGGSGGEPTAEVAPVPAESGVVAVPESRPHDVPLASAEAEPEPPTREQQYQAAYERGVERGKKSPFALIEKHRGALHQGLLKHAKSPEGKALRGDKLLKWLEDSAEDFASSVAELDPEQHKYWSGYQPTGWLRWLNEVPVAAPQTPPRPLGATLPRPAPPGASERNVAPANAQSDGELRLVPREALQLLASGIGKGGLR